MKISIRKGLGFGLTSGVITTLGLVVGLNSATHSILAVIGGILTIAIADAFSDALGIHVSEEYTNKKSKEIWESTFSTFFSKFVFALTFIIPILLFELSIAIKVSIAWGLALLLALSYIIAKKENEDPKKVISEHIAIAIMVIFLTNYIGRLIATVFI